MYLCYLAPFLSSSFDPQLLGLSQIVSGRAVKFPQLACNLSQIMPMRRRDYHQLSSLQLGTLSVGVHCALTYDSRPPSCSLQRPNPPAVSRRLPRRHHSARGRRMACQCLRAPPSATMTMLPLTRQYAAPRIRIKRLRGASPTVPRLKTPCPKA